VLDRISHRGKEVPDNTHGSRRELGLSRDQRGGGKRGNGAQI
jgi:hypothetical protein